MRSYDPSFKKAKKKKPGVAFSRKNFVDFSQTKITFFSRSPVVNFFAWQRLNQRAFQGHVRFRRTLNNLLNARNYQFFALISMHF